MSEVMSSEERAVAERAKAEFLCRQLAKIIKDYVSLLNSVEYKTTELGDLAHMSRFNRHGIEVEIPDGAIVTTYPDGGDIVDVQATKFVATEFSGIVGGTSNGYAEFINREAERQVHIPLSSVFYLRPFDPQAE